MTTERDVEALLDSAAAMSGGDFDGWVALDPARLRVAMHNALTQARREGAREALLRWADEFEAASEHSTVHRARALGWAAEQLVRAALTKKEPT